MRAQEVLNRDLNRILLGRVPRAYGELPRHLGRYRRICPGGEAFEHAVRLKQAAGPNANTARRFAIWLLGNDVHMPASQFPDLRALLQIMLVIPASSAQSERDFSAQVRLPTPTICSRRVADLALSLR